MLPSVLLIGNFLSKTMGTKGVSEELAEHLERSSERQTITTSTHPGRLRRFADIVKTIIFNRSDYEIANVEVYSSMAFIWAEISARLLFLLRKPFILALHGGGLPLLAERSPARVRRLLSLASAVTTPSRYVEKALKLCRNDIIYLPNGLDVNRYPFQLRMNPCPKLCWLRAFHGIYNPAMAIRTAIFLRERFPDVHLVMIGPDKADGSLEEIQALVRQHKLEHHVEIVGPILKTDVPAWLGKYDIFINTTSLESFGVAVLEAAAMGLPIVTTSVGELPLLWSDEHDALLVPSNDPQAMAEAVTRILTEPGLAERLSRNGRAKAEQYDWAAIFPIWERLLEQTLEKTTTWKKQA